MVERFIENNKKASETEDISKEIDDLNNLYMVPSFSGLGATLLGYVFKRGNFWINKRYW